VVKSGGEAVKRKKISAHFILYAKTLRILASYLFKPNRFKFYSQFINHKNTMRTFRSLLLTLAAFGLFSGLSFGQTGAKSGSTASKSASTSKSSSGAAKPVAVPDDVNALLTKYTCLACHRPDTKLVGPAYVDVAKRKYTNQQIVNLIYEPKPANWPGYPPMAPMKQVPKEDALKIASWINSLAKK
jgi:cytochrome c